MIDVIFLISVLFIYLFFLRSQSYHCLELSFIKDSQDKDQLVHILVLAAFLLHIDDFVNTMVKIHFITIRM